VQAWAEPPKAEAVLAKNAALPYWRAFALLPKLDDDQQEALYKSIDRLGPPDKKLIPVVKSAEASLKDLHRAAAMPKCDWGLAVEDGIDAMMPHLSKARELARLGCLRAQLRFERGQSVAAVDDAADVMALGRHAGSDALMISVLVDYAIERQALKVIAVHVPQLKPDARSLLLARLEHLPAGKTMSEAIHAEKEVFLGGFIRKLGEKDGRERLLKMLGQADEPEIAALAKLSTAELLKAANDMRAVYDRLAKIVLLPPEEVRKAQDDLLADPSLDRRVVQVAEMLMPAVDAARRAEAVYQTRLAMLKAAVALVDGGRRALRREEHHDPYGDGPFKYSAFEGGFVLTSKLEGRDEKPVSLTFGRRAAE
jgi:hypothetical protein